ncbi:hypothetical protein FSBG_00380 [Fusobacterium gonidiaformans 3-1-5R]|uniref:Uncharacterized protein n=1 Tax=Fusobacterium gonidiaformans 3-1-5R TaxID=469605 RepID=E5BFK2_9FUSO|nr:hypothetical protein [Fusobacterium gonidiaformans]EFS20883.1 hypothetical protein FSBG_00380 [Fusobacterium gonidiaformans 3-1-5R]
MGLFGKKESKPFVSNDKLVEIITSYDPDLHGLTWTAVLEKKIEERYLFRNVENVAAYGDKGVIIKYKDLKVRSEFEVKKMREEMEREAGLDLGR